MTAMRIGAVLALAVMALTIVGCDGEIWATIPTISSISGPTSIRAGESAVFTCHATVYGGGPIYYSWSCSSGSFSPDTDSSATWTAPGYLCAARIHVLVRDEYGGENSKTDTIAVIKLTPTEVSVQSSGGGNPGALPGFTDGLRLEK